MWLSRFFRANQRRKQIEHAHKKRRDFEALIAAPDWASYESHLQRPVPQALRRLYSNHRLLLNRRDYLDTPGAVNSFLPFQQSELVSLHEKIGHDVVAIATGEHGAILLLPGSFMPDKVFMLYADGEFDEIVPNVESFVENLRPGAGTSTDEPQITCDS